MDANLMLACKTCSVLGVGLVLMAPLGLVGHCREDSALGAGDRGGFEMDGAYLNSGYWEDGRAEIAFFRVWNTRQNFKTLAGAILVRHHLLPTGDLKVPENHKEAVPAFTQIWIYEEPGGPEGPRRHYREIDMRQIDLRALAAKSSLSTWEGQCSYRAAIDVKENRISEWGTSCRTMLPISKLTRSHSFGSGAFFPGQVPLVVRALDFASSTTHVLRVFVGGALIPASVAAVGHEEILIANRRVRALKVEVTYNRVFCLLEETSPVSILGDVASEEIYWLSEESQRQILRMRGDHYGMELIEEVRAKHWEEDFYPRLQYVEEYP